MNIRKATIKDLPEIDTLLKNAGLPTEGYKDFLENFFVCEEFGTLVGVAGFENHGQFGLARSFAVTPNYQGKGIGRELYQMVEKEAVEKQLQTLFLLTETAQGYFQNFGYKIIHRKTAPIEIQMTTEFRELCPDSAVVMQRVLNSNP